MSTFLVSKGLLCLHDKQNSTWFFVDVKFLLLCSTRHLTRSLRPLLSYRIKHSKRSSLCTRAHVLFCETRGHAKFRMCLVYFCICVQFARSNHFSLLFLYVFWCHFFKITTFRSVYNAKKYNDTVLK